VEAEEHGVDGHGVSQRLNHAVDGGSASASVNRAAPGWRCTDTGHDGQSTLLPGFQGQKEISPFEIAEGK
jgi:hypothetical protein